MACTKQGENVWFACRKRAAMYNDKLNSREGAAELIGVSPSSLADYELGITKVVPVDRAVIMSDVYNSPELLAYYCHNECPIGCRVKIPQEIGSFEQIALALLNGLSAEDLNHIREKIVDIALDGKVDADEEEELGNIVRHLDDVRTAIIRLNMYASKHKKGGVD